MCVNHAGTSTGQSTASSITGMPMDKFNAAHTKKNFAHCQSTTPPTTPSQVKIYSPGYIEQCAAGPSCPVRGGMGCKRCSSSVSCVGWVYVCALSLRCCVFFSLRVLALVIPSFQVSFLQPGKSSLRVLRSMDQGESPPPTGSMLVPLPGGLFPGSELESRHRASSYSRFIEVLQVPSPVGGLGFAAAPAPLAFVSVRFRLSSCLIRWTAECVVYSS